MSNLNSVYIGEQFAKGMFTQCDLFCQPKEKKIDGGLIPWEMELGQEGWMQETVKKKKERKKLCLNYIFAFLTVQWEKCSRVKHQLCFES